MKISEHLKAHGEFRSSLKRLSVDMFVHRRAIEVCVVAAANLTNAALHRTGHVLKDRDIKHQHLYGLLKREAPFGEASELGSYHNELEQLKYSVTHGIERDSGLAERALELFEKVQTITLKHL